MPKVSVILTSFNHEKYIREAIESVLNQTFSDFELIIWDDASTDNSWSIIQEYKDPRIKAFRNETSRRAIYGVNRSIQEIAKGEFIGMQHSDDVWDVQKLAKQVAYLDGHPESVAVFSWAQIIDESGADVPIQWFNQESMSRWQWLRQLFAGENHLNHPSVLIRRSCYGDAGVFKYGLAQTGDAELWSRVLLRSDIFVIPEKLTKHRIFSDGSNTSGSGLVKSIRAENEWNTIRLNYFGLKSAEEIFQIFPALKRFDSPLGCDPRFLLAMACLYECNSRAAWALGLQTLYELITSPDTAAQLDRIYSFNYKSLIELSGQFDPYLTRDLTNQATEIARLEAELQAKDQGLTNQATEIARLEAELQAKDQGLTNQATEIARLEAELQAKDQGLTNQATEIARLEAELQAKDQGLTNQATEIARLEAELQALRMTRWFRLRDILLTHPFGFRKVLLLAVTFGGGLLPRPWRASVKPHLQRLFGMTPVVAAAVSRDSDTGAYKVNVPPAPPETAPAIVHAIANFMTGGSSRLVVDLVEHLGSQYRQMVLTSFNPDPPAYVGVDIEECRFPADISPLVAYLQRTRPDVVHVHYWGDCDDPWYSKVFEAAEHLGIPVIENINTPIAPHRSESVVRYVYVSDYVRRVFGSPDAEHVTVYPGSDFGLFTRGPAEQAPTDCVGMVYRLERDKLNEAAIQPFIRIAQLRPQTRILIVGGGSLYEPYREAVAAAGVAENFEFTGYVSYEQLPALYRRMSLFLAPVWKESFGQVSPFAMSMKVPVIGYDIGAIGEIVGDTSLLAPPADAEALAKIAVDLLDTPEKIHRLGEVQQRRAQDNFSIQAMIAHYAQIYAQVIKQTRKDSA